MKENAEKQADELEKMLIDMIYKHKDYEALKKLTETYPPMFHEDSEKFAITSIIKDYEYKTGAKKGQVVKAHFTINGTFLETITDKKKNSKPISYKGWFSYKRVGMYYEMYMPEKQPTKIEDFFRLVNTEN